MAKILSCDELPFVFCCDTLIILPRSYTSTGSARTENFINVNPVRPELVEGSEPKNTRLFPKEFTWLSVLPRVV